MPRVSFYVDGFILYHAISKLQRPELKWLNLRVLAQSFLEKSETLASVTYFTAPMVWNPEKHHRHREYITALLANQVMVVESRFLRTNKYCNGFSRYCDFYEEKQTEVAFAVRVLTDAYAGVMDRAVLITADSDQIPLVRQMVESFPTLRHRQVGCAKLVIFVVWPHDDRRFPKADWQRVSSRETSQTRPVAWWRDVLPAICRVIAVEGAARRSIEPRRGG